MNVKKSKKELNSIHDPVKNTNSWVRFICHQKPERCLTINGKPMSICARCFGFYLGLLIGFIIPVLFNQIYYWHIRYLIILMVLGVMPLVIDGFTQLMGLRSSSNGLRFGTGLFTGVILGILFNWLMVHVFILD
jgi:uncharacterized membrane protein